jgi:hypothetical protein
MDHAYQAGQVHALTLLRLTKIAEDPTLAGQASSDLKNKLKRLLPKTPEGRLAAIGLLGAGTLGLYNSSRNKSPVAPMPVPYLAPRSTLR